jgi:hypothetical protein
VRKNADTMEAQFAQLEGLYSADLVAMVRSCLALDPLARPQSVFAMQKTLNAALPAANAQKPALGKAPGGLRALVGRLGALTRGKQT